MTTDVGLERPHKTVSEHKLRNLLLALAGMIIPGVLGIWLFNYIELERPLQRVLTADPRNSGVKVEARFDGWVDPNRLVFDLSDVSSTTSRADVFRCLLEYADAMKGHHFKKVILAARGNNKFKIDGDYFQQLGNEYSTQNPVYTIRTFPIFLSNLDGTKPFSEYTGGVLGVLGEEMEQFTEFHDIWYVRDFQTGSASIPTITEAKTDSDPCEGLRETNPHCGWTPHWEHSGISTNAIDGTKEEFLSIESTDAAGVDFGKLHYAELRICFEDGHLCHGKAVGVAVDVNGMVASLGYEAGEQYSTAVRLKFDEETPLRQTWGIADSHDALFPYGHEKQFLVQLMQHKKLVLEFSYYEKAPRTVTFDISGLSEVMKAANLQD